MAAPCPRQLCEARPAAGLWVGTSLVPRVFRRLCLEFSIACAADVCSVRCLPLSIGLVCLVFVIFIFGVSF